MLRRLFRFHLLTLVFASFVAGFLLYLNCSSPLTGTIKDPFWEPSHTYDGMVIPGSPKDFETRDYGWPEKFIKCPLEGVRPNVFLWAEFIKDLSICLAIVFIASLAFEILFYRIWRIKVPVPPSLP